MRVSLIAAVDSKNGIGKNGDIPWNLGQDLKHFQKLTIGDGNNVVIMGRKTWDSLPNKHKPLKKRGNIVLTSNKKFKDCISFNNLENALDYAKEAEHVFIIGGAKLYNEAMHKNLVTNILLTRLYKDFKCDTFINNIPENYMLIDYTPKYECYENDKILYRYQFLEYELTNETHEEHKYLNLLKKVLNKGSNRDDRTGTGTISTFGEKMEFDLQKGFPLLTTKSVPFKMVYKELLFFLRGQSDNKILQDQNVHIWDDNTTREFLDNRGLNHYVEGDIGSGYGFQWRHYGAKYKGCKKDYTGQGVDQIKYCINLIKNDPTSRRIIFTGWNPAALNEMCLPPCHSIVVQFYVRDSKYLDCQMYQRSGDCFLGVPFNIASYSLLTHMMAHVTGLEAGKFIHVLGDTHIYTNHIEQCKIQIEREPLPFPQLNFLKNHMYMEQFDIESFEIIGYKNHPKLDAKMAI